MRKVYIHNCFLAGCSLSHGLKFGRGGNFYLTTCREDRRHIQLLHLVWYVLKPWYDMFNSRIMGSSGGIFWTFHCGISLSDGILTSTKTGRKHFQKAKCSFNRLWSSSWALWALQSALSLYEQPPREGRHLNINGGGPDGAEGCPVSSQTQEVLYCSCSCLITTGLFATITVIVWKKKKKKIPAASKGRFRTLGE